MIIKRLFIHQPIWTYDDLWAVVKRPPFGVEFNPALFSENNFVIALNNLVVNTIDVISLSRQRQELSELLLVEKLFDYSERYIYVNGIKHKIEQIDKYYILFPLVNIPANPLNIVYTEYIEHIRDKDRALIRELSKTSGREKLLVDVETYTRPVKKKPGIRINIGSFVRESRDRENYLIRRDKAIAKYENVDNLYDFLIDYDSAFQMEFVEDCISDIVLQLLGKKQRSIKIADKFIQLYNEFGAIVCLGEVKKYKDTAKLFENGLPAISPKTPIGYLRAKSIRLFDAGEKSRWFDVSKLSMNKHLTFNENDIVIGYMENSGDHMNFKLRKPSQIIRANFARQSSMRKISRNEKTNSSTRVNVNDTRLIEKGIVCYTKNKEDLVKIASRLNIPMAKLNKNEIRIKKLCDVIRLKLIELEIKERAKDSKLKYLYSWWDELSQVII